MRGETRKESACWRAVLRAYLTDCPLRRWLALDQLIAERSKR